MKVNMKNKTNRYLMVIFVLMFILCGCLFLLLMKYMMNSGKKTAAEISGFYMDRMSTQIIKHFDTTVEIKLAQVESIGYGRKRRGQRLPVLVSVVGRGRGAVDLRRRS